MEKSGAGEGNRTLVSSLGSLRSTIELHPHLRGSEVSGRPPALAMFLFRCPGHGLAGSRVRVILPVRFHV
jgi:hypothetical protein